jgi:hypothetical protein
MLKFRSAPSPEKVTRPSNHKPQPLAGLEIVGGSSVEPQPFVRRRLSQQGGRALEILGHAIEYLADEYAADLMDKRAMGNADPRIEAIQVLKALNRAVYFSGTEIQPAFQRIRRWFLGSRMWGSRST